MRAALLLLCALVLAPPSASAAEVVRTGDQLPGLLGEAPGTIVGFAWVSNRWVQIPVQVDEREWLDIGTAYVGRDQSGCATISNCNEFVGLVEVLEYTDAGTLVGPDSDPRFDADDELVFMERFAGDLAPDRHHPPAVVQGTRTIVVTEAGVVYLYASRSGLDPAAGQDLVRYHFELEAGPFPEAYDFIGIGRYDTVEDAGERPGANPEVSFAETAFYRQEFTDRWISDALFVKRSRARGVSPDLIDRRKFRFEPGFCDRSEWTASVSRGTVVAAIDGPVRGIRVVRGFNSGPFTTRTTYFYEQDVVSVTDVRVHPVPSLMDAVDYAPSLRNATYSNQENIALPIDGRPDPFAAASRPVNRPFWEVVNGEDGSVATALQLATDWAPLETVETVYLEGTLYEQCTGDDADRGTSGLLVDARLPWTDPRNREYVTVAGLRRTRPAAAPISRAEAEALAQRAFTYYSATPTRRYDGVSSSGGGVEPPTEPPVEPPEPPVEPPTEPPADDAADLAIVYDGQTATVTNLGSSVATGATAGYRGPRGILVVDVPALAPGETYQRRIGQPVDDCVEVRPGDQDDPDLANNRACQTGDAAAYPNPFNPSTQITYTLPRRTEVSVRVFDVLGRQVATLVDGEPQAGTQTIRFEAGHLASGLYLYRIETPARTTTGRLLLLK